MSFLNSDEFCIFSILLFIDIEIKEIFCFRKGYLWWQKNLGLVITI